MADTPVVIKVRDNGPYLVEGPITIEDAEGHPFTLPEGRAVALCRCGMSTTKPFCSGAHRNGFQDQSRA
ncbi:MAG: CDGSH iron-sulfur domain-containing protein [Firmicutes bacterium]|nr:CDGSH iron-sulfur domain-containing protein [Alicyclobacillaceae bacterium]MCL6496637.1 CDGSH iron-sulfur domain-containing protein [Bacillota bacterium]